LWAIADLPVAAQIEQTHQAAVAAAFAVRGGAGALHPGWYGRGTPGQRHRLVAAAFTHPRLPRGDPDLHTHVAVANKVQTLGGRWLSIDGRILHAAKVAASETYNTALEYHLTTFLGVRFAERAVGTARSSAMTTLQMRVGRSARWQCLGVHGRRGR
jgi:hypothetical protein